MYRYLYMRAGHRDKTGARAAAYLCVYVCVCVYDRAARRAKTLGRAGGYNARTAGQAGLKRAAVPALKTINTTNTSMCMQVCLGVHVGLRISPSRLLCVCV